LFLCNACSDIHKTIYSGGHDILVKISNNADLTSFNNADEKELKADGPGNNMFHDKSYNIFHDIVINICRYSEN